MVALEGGMGSGFGVAYRALHFRDGPGTLEEEMSGVSNHSDWLNFLIHRDLCPEPPPSGFVLFCLSEEMANTSLVEFLSSSSLKIHKETVRFKGT